MSRATSAAVCRPFLRITSSTFSSRCSARDGSGSRVITADLDRGVGNPTWAADGQGLFFTYNNEGNGKVAHVTLDGQVKVLADDLGNSIGRPYAGGSYSVSPQGRFAFTTSPRTDLWQRTYYGFRNDNAPALLLTTAANITFTVRVSFDYQHRFDQAGVLVHRDSDNWAKASVEFEDPDLSRLGSVVTNRGYSDWATRDVPTPRRMWYQVSRRGPDFLIQNSTDGQKWEQMRITHLHKVQPKLKAGIYACSPMNGRFTCTFDYLSIHENFWQTPQH